MVRRLITREQQLAFRKGGSEPVEATIWEMLVCLPDVCLHLARAHLSTAEDALLALSRQYGEARGGLRRTLVNPLGGSSCPME